MSNRNAFLATFCFLLLAGCDRSGPPAPVLDLGVNLDSASGAVMVSEGDTLWNISQRYDLPLRDLIDINHLSPPYMMAVGQRLKIPAPRNYNVQSTDTLYGISRTFGIDVTELVRANHIAAPYSIHVGQQLRIPASYKQRFATILSADRQDTSRPAISVEPPKGYRMAAPRAHDWGDRLQWPVSGKVVSGFGPKTGGLHNDGINIAAPRGAPVLAADAGTVVYTGNELEGYGNLVLIRHSDGMITAYAHLAAIHVTRGAAVMRGQTIGTVGSTGSVDSPQVHFEVRRGSAALDPEQYLDGRA